MEKRYACKDCGEVDLDDGAIIQRSYSPDKPCYFCAQDDLVEPSYYLTWQDEN
ncbi:MAG TPA: hypothetical protein VGF75_05065 [Candidatus Saccharimonadales bacterium]|jgi:hypothetical protein